MTHFYSVHDRLRETTKLIDNERDLFDFLYRHRRQDEPNPFDKIHLTISELNSSINNSVNVTGESYDGFRFFITIHFGRFV